MPFYDLQCDQCGNTFNKKASIHERDQKLIQCPVCGSNDLSAVFTSVNIIQNRSKSAPECPNLHKCGGCCQH